MIVYGIKAKILASRLFQFLCGSCGQGEQTIHVLQRYFHIFWIPVFPLNKKIFLECKHCKLTLDEKQFKPEIKIAVDNARRSVRAPAWMFSGLVVIALLIGYGYYDSQRSEEQTRAYVQQPAAGDLAVYKLKDEYHVMKIVAVNAGLIEYRSGNYFYKSGSDAQRDSHKKAGSEDYLTKQTFTLPVADYQVADIYSVER